MAVNKDWTFWSSSPFAAILFPFLYIFMLFIFGVVEPTYFVSTSSYYYLFVGLAAMAFMAWLGMRAGPMRIAALAKRSQITRKMGRMSWLSYVRMLYLLAFLGAFFSILDILLSIPLDILFNPIAIRNYFLDRMTTWFAYPGNILFPFCSVTIGVVLLHYEKMPTLYRILGLLIALIPPFLLALGLAGRQGIIQLFLLIVWWCLQRPSLGQPIFPRSHMLRISIVMVLILIIFTIGVIAVSRSEQVSQYNALLLFNENSIKIDDTIKDELDRLDEISPFFSNFIGEATLYWSAPVVYFDRVFNSWDFPLTYVSVFSPFLQRRLSSLSLVPSQEDVNAYWKGMLWNYDLFPNAWGTTWTQMVQSLGRVGGMFAALIVAYISGVVYVWSRKTLNFAGLYMSSMFFCFFFLWFQFTVFVSPLFEWGIFWAFFGRSFLRKFNGNIMINANKSD